MDLALKVGFLAFDATRTSSTSVEYPLDVVAYRTDTFDIVEFRFEKEDLLNSSAWWQARISESVDQLPAKWTERVLSLLSPPTRSPRPDHTPGPA
jgi:putative proteasome-type protease